MDVFCFEQRTAYEIRVRDWSSDVCSTDRRLVVRPRAFHAWAELDRHILYLSGGDAGLARLGGGAAAVAVSRHLSGRGNGAGLAVRPRRCISLHAVVRRRLDADGRSAERRVGKECVITCRSWWSPLP